jgi:protoheme IX farnesyltransferase
MMRVIEHMKWLAELCKVKLSLSVAFACGAGYMLASSASGVKAMIAAVAGVFLSASGCCALNQYQEKDIDALMPRTGNRPLPSGKIEPLHALFFSLALILIGECMIYIGGGLMASVFGVSAVIWYNGVYTYLKRKTAFAAVPGAFIGAIPPLIGWITGGGHILDIRVLSMCFFFFMWQVPHFWLFLLRHGDEYEKAGLPSLTGVFTMTQLARIIRQWMLAALLSGLVLALYDIALPVLKVSVLILSCWLLYSEVGLVRGIEIGRARSFARLNLYMTAVLLVVSFDRLVLLGMPEWVRLASWMT